MTQREAQELVHPLRMTPRSQDYIFGGITKEEYFTCQILCSILSTVEPIDIKLATEEIVARSILISKELIKQL